MYRLQLPLLQSEPPLSQGWAEAHAPARIIATNPSWAISHRTPLHACYADKTAMRRVVSRILHDQHHSTSCPSSGGLSANAGGISWGCCWLLERGRGGTLKRATRGLPSMFASGFDRGFHKGTQSVPSSVPHSEPDTWKIHEECIPALLCKQQHHPDLHDEQAPVQPSPAHNKQGK